MSILRCLTTVQIGRTPDWTLGMSSRLIKSIHIEGLFGLYSYTLPQDSSFGDASILYGDNGIGKSTILKLVFHLLSPAPNKGHRGALHRTEFRKLEVNLVSGVTVSAIRTNDEPSRILNFAISRSGRDLALWRYRPGRPASAEYEWHIEVDAKGQQVVRPQLPRRKRADAQSVPEGEEAFLSALAQHAPVMFSLNAERRLDSDDVPDPGDEMELRRLLRSEDSKRVNDLAVRSREIALSQALNAASRWISRKAIQGANQGSTNVHSVYLNVLRHLTGQETHAGTAAPVDVANLQKRIANIESKTSELARYELQTALSTSEFRKVLNGRAKRKVELAAGLLEPYVESIEARIQALEPTYRTIDRFVKIANGLLQDKTLGYQLSVGFIIQNRLGLALHPAQLSSGEQQLLLLFCYVLTGRDKPSVFMIDEPEISLNIKWQRQLVQSLLDITGDATIQFIFASHSLELLSQHRNRVVRLVNEK